MDRVQNQIDIRISFLEAMARVDKEKTNLIDYWYSLYNKASEIEQENIRLKNRTLELEQENQILKARVAELSQPKA